MATGNRSMSKYSIATVLGLVALAFSACGGAVRSDLLALVDAGDASDDGVSEVSVSTDSGSAYCDNLLLQLDEARSRLTECCPTCNSQQCGSAVDDVCCPLYYTDVGANREVANQFAQVVARYKSACRPECLPSPCQSASSFTCDPGRSRCVSSR